MKLAVFIERDAILNEVKAGARQQISPRSLEEFKVIRTSLQPLLDLKEAGFLLIVTTNQSGVSRGDLCRRELDRMHDSLRRTFPIDDLMLCAHDEADRCPCRKPKPGLLIEAAFKWKIDLDRSFVLSDKWQDAEAARTAGCTSVLVQSPYNGPVHRDFVMPDVPSACVKILQLSRPKTTISSAPVEAATAPAGATRAKPRAKKGVTVS